MGGYEWRGGEDERAAEAAEMVHEAIKNEAKRRTGWREWMTEEVGYAALGDDWIALAERRDSGR